MTEEEVNAKFLEMNKEIFIKKLNIDLDRCYDNMNVIFSNIINAFQKDMELRIYEISFDSESILSRYDIEIKTKAFFDKIREYIKSTIQKNESLLVTYINSQDLDNYIGNIELCSSELNNGISELYLREVDLLLNDLGRKMDIYSKVRLNKILKEILYNHFMERSKTTIDNVHSILKNNIHNNTEYLENMNKSTTKTH